MMNHAVGALSTMSFSSVMTPDSWSVCRWLENREIMTVKCALLAFFSSQESVHSEGTIVTTTEKEPSILNSAATQAGAWSVLF